MPATRTTVNLKHTSIHDHLLNNKIHTHSTMDYTTNTSTSDTKHSPYTSADTSQYVQNTVTDNDDCHLLVKPSMDYLNSILFVNNSRQKLSPISQPLSQHPVTQSTSETCEQVTEKLTRSSGIYYQQASEETLTFSGEKNEDSGKWLDHVLAVVEQKELTSSEQRDLAAGRLTGEALLWYRLNRLKMPDMQSFIHQFLLTYNLSQTKSSNTDATSKDVHYTYTLPDQTIVEKESEQVYYDTSKSTIEKNHFFGPSTGSASPLYVLQSARNEKIKLFPNFSGAENSLHWLKNLQQICKSLKLNDQQIYELATIKLSGPAQEWFYHQGDEIDNWLSFKQVFLHAFPPPIQPSNIDYLAQLLARKQGENEPVGKFVQDINRLCLKLDDKVSEQDKLQYLRRGLRPQLQHYALSIASLQDFLTVMQRHEQIEKETTSNQQFLPSFKSSSRPTQQQQTSSNRSQQNNYHHQSNQYPTYGPSDRYPHQNSHTETTTQRSGSEFRICYQCNKPGHLQRNCPDINSSQQHQPSQQQHFQQRSH